MVLLPIELSWNGEHCEYFVADTEIDIPIEECKLPLEPEAMGEVDKAAGTRFGSKPESRQEYDTIPGNLRVR